MDAEIERTTTSSGSNYALIVQYREVWLGSSILFVILGTNKKCGMFLNRLVIDSKIVTYILFPA